MPAAKLDVDRADFSGSQLCAVAKIDRKLLNLWIERKVIKPADREELGQKTRPWFSVANIFQARLIKVLSESLLLGSPSSKELWWATDLANPG